MIRAIRRPLRQDRWCISFRIGQSHSDGLSWQSIFTSCCRELEASRFSEEPMRCVAGLLAIACAGGLSLALADPPATTPVAPIASTRPTQIAPATPAIPATTDTPAGTRAETPSAALASSTAASNEVQIEKQLRAQGYSPQMHNGERVFCRREVPLGSHLATVLNCVTASEAERIAKNSRGDIEKVQRKMNPCIANGNGRSANCGS